MQWICRQVGRPRNHIVPGNFPTAATIRTTNIHGRSIIPEYKEKSGKGEIFPERYPSRIAGFRNR